MTPNPSTPSRGRSRLTFLRRAAVLIAATAGLIAGTSGMANAATPAPSDNWTCDQQVCLRVVKTTPGSTVTPADAQGCNGSVCITVTGNATNGYSTVGQGFNFFGHIQVFGPGGLQTTGSEANNPVASGSGHGSGQTCAVGWKAVTGGGHTQVGKPCETVS